MSTNQQNPLSPEALKELRELEQKATPGPWDLFGVTDSGLLPDIIDANLNHVARVHGHNAMAPGQSRYDAELIAAMRNALPALLAELDRLTKENAELKKPDYAFDVENWEYSIPIDDANELGDPLGIGEMMRVGHFHLLPERWLARIPTAVDGEGDVEDDELMWFDTEEEAKAAIEECRNPTPPGGSNGQ